MSRGRQIVRLKLREPSEAARAAYLLEWEAKTLRLQITTFPPLRSEELFANSAPLEVEIGPGTAEYLCSLAARKMGTNFLGIEASRRAAYYAVNLAADLNLANLRVIRANIKWLYPLMQPETWSKVYLHFPDPAHKRKDEKHRVFDQSFLDVMARVLVPGGEISVLSDKVDFFDEMLAIAENDARFERSHSAPFLEGFEPQQKSRFQLFWERKGIMPRRFIVRKKS